MHTVALPDAYLNAGWTDAVDAVWTTSAAAGADPHRIGFTRVNLSPHGYLT